MIEDEDGSCRDIRAALDKLATEGTSGQIAEALLAQGCQGERGQRLDCPVARYVKSTTGVPVSIGGAHWEFDGGFVYLLPPNVGEFVELFDDGQYPQLVRGGL